MAHFMHDVLASLVKHSSLPLLKRFTGSPTRPSWESISYGEYLVDLEKMAAYWFDRLSSQGVKESGVVGLWLSGTSPTNLVHLYAICRAGFIPQVFSVRLAAPGPIAINKLLNACGGTVLIHDQQFSEILADFPLAKLVAPDISTVKPLSITLPELPQVQGSDIAMIFHTSGTTSGMPKPIPETHSWLTFQAKVQWPGAWQGKLKTQTTLNNLGAFTAVGSATCINYLSWSGQCVVQTSATNFGADELLAMIRECGLNNLLLYAPWFSNLLSIARKNAEVLEALRGMTQIAYTGAALNPEDEAWIIEQDLPATALYATTESDLSDRQSLPAMRVVKGTKCRFIPASLDTSDLDSNSEKRSRGGRLFDFFIPDDTPNCPHPSVRNRPDGHITGDLFEEIQPGYYAFRGRNDDWIRVSNNRYFCDTKSIEDNILKTCSDFVQNCVLVGHYKPRLVLFAEPFVAIQDDEEIHAFKERILQRHSEFNSQLYESERINSPLQIVVAAPGSLPRTKEKGNIRRKAAEDEHAELLKSIYEKLEV
ncbi:acetyl-CoA synthetase-like protein [Crucibulum laeve]|uniref:Acetyl-CoA synthetase-like protein n=1 Tax=Crucibulum laeve TaxID=68775 RepID=A0A5C3LZY1_9AGAR|nr:acetyl-CoA synthetase-like protein [Crucibulum laeve]